MVGGGRQPRNRPPTLGTMSVDFYRYPVMVWAYFTPQPNTVIPSSTGGIEHLSTGWCQIIQSTAMHILLYPWSAHIYAMEVGRYLQANHRDEMWPEIESNVLSIDRYFRE